MDSPQFDIVFRGVRKGFDLDETKSKFAALFKLDALKVERIFKSRKVTLKAQVDERIANIFVARLAAIGVETDKLLVFHRTFKAIHSVDKGVESIESGSMHQPIECVYGEHTRRIPLVFQGKGLEYAKLCLVNCLVCVLSAGILYPWAKVRSLRYFYQHTRLDNVEFHYTSNPQRIFLLQFLINLYILMLGYNFFYAPWFFVVGIAMLLLALPLCWLKSKAFSSAHSFYRDCGFTQTLNVREAYYVFLLWPLAMLATAGLSAPYAIYKMHSFWFRSVSFGKYPIQFNARVKDYLLLLPPLIAAELVTAVCLYGRVYLPVAMSVAVVVGMWLYVFLRWRVLLINVQWNHIASPLGYFGAYWDMKTYSQLMVRNWVLSIITLGLYWPWARINLAKYNIAHIVFFANQRFAKWKKCLESVQ